MFSTPNKGDAENESGTASMSLQSGASTGTTHAGNGTSVTSDVATGSQIPATGHSAVSEQITSCGEAICHSRVAPLISNGKVEVSAAQQLTSSASSLCTTAECGLMGSPTSETQEIPRPLLPLFPSASLAYSSSASTYPSASSIPPTVPSLVQGRVSCNASGSCTCAKHSAQRRSRLIRASLLAAAVSRERSYPSMQRGRVAAISKLWYTLVYSHSQHSRRVDDSSDGDEDEYEFDDDLDDDDDEEDESEEDEVDDAEVDFTDKSPALCVPVPSGRLMDPLGDINGRGKGADQKNKRKCWTCKKKIGLASISCRCGYTFCSVHRYAEKHDCTYDYKSVGKRRLEAENPVVRPTKVLKIC